MRKSHSEHFSTAVPQKADVVLNAANGSFVPAADKSSYIPWTVRCEQRSSALATLVAGPVLFQGDRDDSFEFQRRDVRSTDDRR